MYNVFKIPTQYLQLKLFIGISNIHALKVCMSFKPEIIHVCVKLRNI